MRKTKKKNKIQDICFRMIEAEGDDYKNLAAELEEIEFNAEQDQELIKDESEQELNQGDTNG